MPDLSLTMLELEAIEKLEVHRKEREAIEGLAKRVRSAMEEYLFDPFSAEYRKLRAGRNGAVCGQVNAKNRLGAYVGFRDFVVGKDGKTVYSSGHSDGVETELYSSFAEAYVNACASKVEANRHAEATAPVEDYYSAEDAADAAAEAADDAARAMEESEPLIEEKPYW